MATSRMNNALPEKAPEDAISFNSIFDNIVQNVKNDLEPKGETLRQITTTEKRNINEGLKRKYNYYQRTSKFPVNFKDDIREYIQKRLKKFIVKQEVQEIDSKQDDQIKPQLDEHTPLDFDTDQKLVEIIEIIEKNGLSKTSDISQIWVSRYKLNIIGLDEIYWILLVGPSKELDYADKLDDKFNLIESPKTKTSSYWRNLLLPKFNSEDEMDDTIFLVVCSEKRAQEYKYEHGTELFYALRFGEHGKSKTLDEFEEKLSKVLADTDINK